MGTERKVRPGLIKIASVVTTAAAAGEFAADWPYEFNKEYEQVLAERGPAATEKWLVKMALKYLLPALVMRFVRIGSLLSRLLAMVPRLVERLMALWDDFFGRG